MKIILYTLIAASIFTVSSCKKEKKTSVTETPFTGSVELSSPHEGDTIAGNIYITGTITGSSEMHGYHLGVYRTDNQELIYENQYHEHGESYQVSELVNHTLTDTTNLKVVIEAVVEHEGETVTKTVNFVYKP